MGHRVRLLPPSDVSRYRGGNKTDRADAKALHKGYVGVVEFDGEDRVFPRERL